MSCFRVAWFWKASHMAASYELNRFERALFGIAVALAIVIVAVRVGAMTALWLMRH